MTLVNPADTPVPTAPAHEEPLEVVYPRAIQSFGDLPSIEEFFHSLVKMDESGAVVREEDGTFHVLIPTEDALVRFGNLTRDYGTLLRARENLTLLIQYLEPVAPFIMAKTCMEQGCVIDFHKLGAFLLESVQGRAHGETATAGTEEELEGTEAPAENVLPFGAQA